MAFPCGMVSRLGMGFIAEQFFSAILGTIVGTIFAALIERWKWPVLTIGIVPPHQAVENRVDPQDPSNVVSQQPYTAACLFVKNEATPWSISWFTCREPALSCHVEIEFYDNGKRIFGPISARWAASAQPPFLPQVLGRVAPHLLEDLKRRDVEAGKDEVLDIAVLHPDSGAYVFSNASYIHGGIFVPSFKLPENDRWTVVVRVRAGRRNKEAAFYLYTRPKEFRLEECPREKWPLLTDKR